MLRAYTIPQLAGTVAGTSSPTVSPLNGEVVGLHVANNSGGTLTINTVHAPQVTVLTMATAGTTWYYPRAQAHLVDTTALTYDGSHAVAVPVPVADYLQCVLNAAGTVNVTVLAHI